MRNLKVSESKSVRINFCSNPESVRIWMRQNLKVSEPDSVRTFMPWDSGTFRFQIILTLSGSDTFRFWHFQILTHSDSDNFRFGTELSKIGILTLSDSDTFRFWHIHILTLSGLENNWQKLGFWHFQILTLSAPQKNRGKTENPNPSKSVTCLSCKRDTWSVPHHYPKWYGTRAKDSSWQIFANMGGKGDQQVLTITGPTSSAPGPSSRDCLDGHHMCPASVDITTQTRVERESPTQVLTQA